MPTFHVVGKASKCLSGRVDTDCRVPTYLQGLFETSVRESTNQHNSIIRLVMENRLEKARSEAKQLCAHAGVTIVPYGNAWWLVGKGINRVVGELAGLCPSQLMPLPMMER